ncbi:MAG TPA: glycosyltransferase family 2 protein [Planctomycetota bacterium]|nr:glycosyltransferase family 2 protein [Planctomycetota bacterium]
MPRTLISVVINTRNEIRHIADCIRSVRGFATEIVVCDMHSEDGTAEAARALGARVIDHPVCRFVEPARYAAISAAHHDWVLVVDADERLTPSLAARLRAIMVEGKHRAVSIAFLTQFAGHWLRHGPSGELRVVRFFRRQTYFDSFQPSELQLHENFKSLRALPDLVTLDLTTPMLHLAYPSVTGLVLKQILYADEDAQKRWQNGEAPGLARTFRRVIDRARKALISQRGWRDGLPGWLFAAVMCTYELISATRLAELHARGRAQEAATAGAAFEPPPALLPRIRPIAPPVAGLPAPAHQMTFPPA